MGFPQLLPAVVFSTGCLAKQTAGAAAGLMSRSPLAAPACLCGVDTRLLDRGCECVVYFCSADFWRRERNVSGYIQKGGFSSVGKPANYKKKKKI